MRTPLLSTAVVDIDSAGTGEALVLDPDDDGDPVDLDPLRPRRPQAGFVAFDGAVLDGPEEQW